MRSISIVASGVEIGSYDSMVSCQWPNVLPGVSTLSWSFVVSVRLCVLGSKTTQLFQSSWLQSVVTRIYKYSTNIGEASPSTVKIMIFNILFLSIIFLLDAMSANYRRILSL